ncbi:MAG: glycosyltransferase family 2 protein [Anaerolineae bacterium]|nr:glycosyltransferase family 2 protein [Anaerolineae bacterium]
MIPSLELSIIIVNWNTCDLLRQCLTSVQDNFRAREHLNIETLVVDNASNDDSRAMVQEYFPWVQLIENAENVGFAQANNQGMKRAEGEFLLLLNSDTCLLPGALQAMLAFIAAHPPVGACGARLLNADGSLQPSCQPMLTPEREFWRLSFLDMLLPRATYRMASWPVDQPRQVEIIKGACLLLRRAALDQIGWLDEAYFMYTEEVDLCYRLAQAGWELWWVPQAQVIHYGAASSKQAAEAMYLQLYRSKVQFYRKFGGEQRARRFKWLVRLAYWPRLAAATLIPATATKLGNEKHIYLRLLAELPKM